MMKKLVIAVMAVAMLLAYFALAEDYAIATDTAFRPFEFTDETGTLVGIDVEILTAIAEDQGYRGKVDLDELFNQANRVTRVMEAAL